MAKSKKNLKSKDVKVVLLSRIRNLKKGSVVSVKGGYMRNYLSKKNLAVKYSEDALKSIATSEKDHSQDQVIMDKINNSIFLFERQATTSGILFSSVSKKDVISAIAERFGVQLAARKIFIDSPIKHVGKYEIYIEYGEAAGKIYACVGRNRDEAHAIESSEAKTVARQGTVESEAQETGKE